MAPAPPQRFVVFHSRSGGGCPRSRCSLPSFGVQLAPRFSDFLRFPTAAGGSTVEMPLRDVTCGGDESLGCIASVGDPREHAPERTAFSWRRGNFRLSAATFPSTAAPSVPNRGPRAPFYGDGSSSEVPLVDIPWTGHVAATLSSTTDPPKANPALQTSSAANLRPCDEPRDEPSPLD